MRALVTGGAGHIGSTLVDALLDRGDEVTVFDDFSSGREENIAAALERGAELIRGIVSVQEEMAAAGEATPPDVVFHLAAHAHIAYSLENPTHDLRINVEGTVNALEVARKAGARFVFAASCAEYGDPAAADVPMPLTEDAPLAPISPYGAEQARGRGLRHPLPGPARAAITLAALRQRLRAPADAARRGGGRFDLLPAAARGGPADRLRQRPADSRLHLRR